MIDLKVRSEKLLAGYECASRALNGAAAHMTNLASMIKEIHDGLQRELEEDAEQKKDSLERMIITINQYFQLEPSDA